MIEKPLFCSFCAKSQEEVAALVAGPDVNICLDCVQLCVGSLTEAGHWPDHSPAALHRGLMALAAYIGPKCVSTVNAAVAGQPAGEGV